MTRSLRPSLVAQTLACCVGLMAIGGCGDSDSPARQAGGSAGQDQGGTNAEAGSADGGSTMSTGGVVNPSAGSNPIGGGGNAQGGNQTAGTGGTGGGLAGGGTAGSIAGGGSGGAGDPCAPGAAPSNVDCCPDDPDKTTPGQCGCGHPDENDCLIHRYSFESSVDGVVPDLVGDAPATVIKGSVSGGAANIAGFNSEEYVALNGGIVSKLSSATFEIWVTWDGVAGDWQRIWDFGNSTGGPGNQGSEGETYLFLTPRAGDAGGLRVAYSLDSYRAETRADGVHPMPINQRTHVAVVVDPINTKLLLYLEGQLEASTDWFGTLGAIHDENNWLGRSQFLADPELGGKIYEFRMYTAPRTAEQILESYQAGPDVLPNDAGAGGAGGAGGESAAGASGMPAAAGAPGAGGAG